MTLHWDRPAIRKQQPGGFTYSLVVASWLLAADDGRLGPVLVVGAENLTRVVNPTYRSMVILFGAAAGAVVVVPSLRIRSRPDLGQRHPALGRPTTPTSPPARRHG